MDCTGINLSKTNTVFRLKENMKVSSPDLAYLYHKIISENLMCQICNVRSRETLFMKQVLKKLYVGVSCTKGNLIRYWQKEMKTMGVQNTVKG